MGLGHGRPYDEHDAVADNAPMIRYARITYFDSWENQQCGFRTGPTQTDLYRKELEEELHYPCSENKGADQLRGHREADLRLCFRLCRLLVFP